MRFNETSDPITIGRKQCCFTCRWKWQGVQCTKHCAEQYQKYQIYIMHLYIIVLNSIVNRFYWLPSLSIKRVRRKHYLVKNDWKSRSHAHFKNRKLESLLTLKLKQIAFAKSDALKLLESSQWMLINLGRINSPIYSAQRLCLPNLK